MDPVVVIGEALVDVVDRPDGRVEHPGGSPMNVAVGLARLGVPTRLVCALGQDERGAVIRAHVGASGVELDTTTIDHTSTAVATIDADGAATYEFDLDWRLAAVAVPDTVPLVHVGSIGAVLQPGAAAVLDAVRHRPPGTLVSIDPNVRPSITPDAGAVRAALAPLFAEADVVKLSDEDAAWLWPDRDVDAVLDGLLESGATMAAVTLGGAGCALASASRRIAVPAPAVEVVDTIGAGDSFMAGLLDGVLTAGRSFSDDLETLAAHALACARVTVSRPGADPPRSAELPT